MSTGYVNSRPRDGINPHYGLFARSLAASGNSLVANQNLITRVYFPRLAAPIAPVLAAGVDFALAFAVLLGLMLGITSLLVELL